MGWESTFLFNGNLGFAVVLGGVQVEGCNVPHHNGLPGIDPTVQFEVFSPAKSHLSNKKNGLIRVYWG